MKKFSVMEWMDNILALDLCHRGDAGLEEGINAIITVVRTIKIFIVLPVRVFFSLISQKYEMTRDENRYGSISKRSKYSSAYRLGFFVWSSRVIVQKLQVLCL